MATSYQVPGVYFEPRPRAPEPLAVRTDVVGFVGFEPRFAPSRPPSRLTGTPDAALDAVLALAGDAVIAAAASRGAVQAIVAAAAFPPAVPDADAARQAARASADATAALARRAPAARIGPLADALARIAGAARDAERASGRAAAATSAGEGAAALAAANAALASADAARADAVAAAAGAHAVLQAARAARLRAAAAADRTRAVRDANVLPAVDPERAAALAAAADAAAAAIALAAAAAATHAASVVGAATSLAASVRDAALATREAADARGSFALSSAVEAVELAAGAAAAREAELAAEVADVAWSPPVGHDFRVEVRGFALESAGVRGRVPALPGLRLSRSENAIPIADGGSIVYALVAADGGRAAPLVVVPVAGAPDAGPLATPPTDAEVELAVAASVGAGRRWTRLAAIVVRRAGDAIAQAIEPDPALRATRCDDWADYLLRLGVPDAADPSLLAPAVRAYFANGGRRCWVSVVRRPELTDAADLEEARVAMIGAAGAGEREATGLERLLLIDEVSVVDVPDLYARLLDRPRDEVELPASAANACFRVCDEAFGARVAAVVSGPGADGDPLFAPDDVFDAQWRMLRRCAPERWRVLLLLAPPLDLPPSLAAFAPPTPLAARAWRDRFDVMRAADFLDANEMSCAALYFPWLRWQERVDAEVRDMPPTPFAAGVIARRDVARGPHVAPANETLRGVVALALDAPLGDATHGALAEPPVNVNVVRAFSGYGVQAWGARTLSDDTWLRYVPVRRGLSAVQRRVVAALREVVFEPHTPMLWLRVSQSVLGVLLPMYDAGALRGAAPEEAFYVRCDGALNPPESVEQGRLLVEVGVAIAAPAEFIVFRVGRREGVVEVVE